MDDIIALLAREAGKKFVEAQKAAALDAAKRNAAIANAKKPPANTWGTATATPGRGPASAGKTAAQTPLQRVAAAAATAAPARPAPPVPAPRPPALDPLLADSFVIPEFAPEPPHPSIALLSGFSGGTPLLSGIVISEALAPPIALREGQLFDRLRR